MLTLIEGFLGFESFNVEEGGCLDAWIGESKATVGSPSIISTSMDDIEILWFGIGIFVSGVCGS